MKVKYDTYYQTENLFGAPSKELINFFKKYPQKGKVLDLGCGQGRDAIALARLGFDVTGIDNSKVGIEQMIQIAKTDAIQIKGIVNDIYEFADFANFDFVLLDSMFHFLKNDKEKETKFIQKIVANVKNGCLLVFCIQDMVKKIEILYNAVNANQSIESLLDEKFVYTYKDEKSGHTSKTDYRIVVFKK